MSSASQPLDPKPRQALSPWMALAWFLAVPGLLVTAALVSWDYPPLWVLNLLAFGPPAASLAAFAVWKLAGKPLRPVLPFAAAAWMFSAGYTVMCVGDIPLLDRAPVLLLCLAVGAVAGAYAWRRIPPNPARPVLRAGVTVFLAGFVAAYAAGTGALINIQADIAPPQHFTARVVAKQVYGEHRQRGRYRDWKITLAPWGPIRRPVRHSVWPEAYPLYETGGLACVDLHRGLLGLRWVDVAPCEPFARRGR